MRNYAMDSSADLERKLAVVLLPILADRDIGENARLQLQTLIKLLRLEVSATVSDIHSALNFAPDKSVQLAVDSLIATFHGADAERALQHWLYSVSVDNV